VTPVAPVKKWSDSWRHLVPFSPSFFSTFPKKGNFPKKGEMSDDKGVDMTSWAAQFQQIQQASEDAAAAAALSIWIWSLTIFQYGFDSIAASPLLLTPIVATTRIQNGFTGYEGLSGTRFRFFSCSWWTFLNFSS